MVRRTLTASIALASALISTPTEADQLFGEAAPREVDFRLDQPRAQASVDLFMPFRDASVERLGPMRLYLHGKWGRRTYEPWVELAWPSFTTPTTIERTDGAPAQLLRHEELFAFDALADRGELTLPDLVVTDRALWHAYPSPTFGWSGPSLESDGFGAFFNLPPVKAPLDWRCRRKPVHVVRYGAESDRVELVRCDGTMAPEALDKLSILLRPPEVARPDGLLPDEPDGAAWSARREWVPGVRVVHPRLVWALQELADAFPGRAIYVYSGYRPDAEVNDGSGHRSLHSEGRAVDLAVFRTPNDAVFEACRELKDVGCGFYPHGKFVHVDVRRAHSGKAFWIDASEPGQPSRYVDGWPGVVDRGGLSWSSP